MKKKYDIKRMQDEVLEMEMKSEKQKKKLEQVNSSGELSKILQK